MSERRLSILTQTPYVRFLRDAPPGARLVEGEDYEVSPGGVTRMIRALLARLTGSRRVDSARWISLAATGPDRFPLDEHMVLEHVRLPGSDLATYGQAKSALWNSLHGLPVAAESSWERVRGGLDLLARAFAARARALHAEDPFDAFYAHDFQLTTLARHLPEGVARLFRWHVPVPRSPTPLLRAAADSLNGYDALVVSTRRYADAFAAAGVKIPVHVRYPYLGDLHRVVTTRDVAEFDDRWGLGPEDAPFLLVARMDPIKSQDVAIKALAAIADRAPNAKILLVGGGGFSGGRAGLGLPAAGLWRRKLERLARDLGVADRVVFTGHLAEAALGVAYTRARAVLLPSRLEGFGLAAVEGWTYGRPALVSTGAGVSELVEEGVNGYAFEPGDHRTLADRMAALARDPDLARELGRAGRKSAEPCFPGPAADAIGDLVDSVVEERRTAIGGRARWS